MQEDIEQQDESQQEPDEYKDSYGHSWNINRSSNEQEHVAAGDRKRFIFTSEEREFISNLVPKYHILKNKKSDFVTLAEKSNAWEDIARKYNAVPQHRKKTSKQLKKLWENINQIMRKKNSQEGCSDRTTPVHFKEDSTSQHNVDSMLTNECRMSNGIEDNPSNNTNYVPTETAPGTLQLTQPDSIEILFSDRIRFTENEKEFLYDQVALYQDIIDSKKCDAYSVCEKQNVWELITQAYNAIPCHNKRTIAQLKKWWDNTKSRRKQECAKINEEDGATTMQFKEEPTDFLLNLGGYSNGTDDTVDSDVASTQAGGIDEDQYGLKNQYQEDQVNGTNAASSKRKNSKRFTLSEKAFLAEIIMTNYNDIIGDSPHTEGLSNEVKSKAWIEVTNHFNAIPHHSKRSKLQLIQLWRAMLRSRSKRNEAISLDGRGTVLGQEDAADFLLRLGLINKPVDNSNDEVIEPSHHEAEIEHDNIYDQSSREKRSAAINIPPLGQITSQHQGNTNSNVDTDQEMRLLVVEEMKQKVALARLKVKAEEAEQKRVADAHALEMAFKKQKWDLELKILRKRLNEE